jgi:hypothetical protein
LGDWWCYESHLVGNKKLHIFPGVRHYDRERFLMHEAKHLHEFELYPVKLDLVNLETLLGAKYGLKDVNGQLWASVFHNNGRQKNRTGVYCTEYLALAFKPIMQYFGLPAHCIPPVLFARYFKEKGISRVTSVSRQPLNGLPAPQMAGTGGKTAKGV